MKINYYLFLLLAFFGKFFDLVNSNIVKWFSLIGFQGSNIYFIKFIFNLIEEIGELSIISLAVMWLFYMTCESLSPQSKKWAGLFSNIN